MHAWVAMSNGNDRLLSPSLPVSRRCLRSSLRSAPLSGLGSAAPAAASVRASEDPPLPTTLHPHSRLTPKPPAAAATLCQVEPEALTSDRSAASQSPGPLSPALSKGCRSSRSNSPWGDSRSSERNNCFVLTQPRAKARVVKDTTLRLLNVPFLFFRKKAPAASGRFVFC